MKRRQEHLLKLIAAASNHLDVAAYQVKCIHQAQQYRDLSETTGELFRNIMPGLRQAFTEVLEEMEKSTSGKDN